MNDTFEMVAKTFQGLEDVLADELRALGAEDINMGRRMVAFRGNLETLYRANFCCRTALRILKPFYKFSARDADELYDKAKDFDWSSILSLSKTFSIDTVAYSDEFSHSRFVTYRIKDAIVDWFKDRYGEDKRPGVRLQDADVMIADRGAHQRGAGRGHHPAQRLARRAPLCRPHVRLGHLPVRGRADCSQHRPRRVPQALRL